MPAQSLDWMRSLHGRGTVPLVVTMGIIKAVGGPKPELELWIASARRRKGVLNVILKGLPPSDDEPDLEGRCRLGLVTLDYDGNPLEVIVTLSRGGGTSQYCYTIAGHKLTEDEQDPPWIPFRP